MGTRETDMKHICDLHAPIRNRYFYGKLLDSYHFELETGYVNNKRWLLNRLITGYGVVCGLDVCATSDGKGIIITPGVAIDKHGREMIVDEQAQPIKIPPELAAAGSRSKEDREHKGHYIHVVLCYHECTDRPTPVLAGDCGVQQDCEPSIIRERYKIELRSGCLPPAEPEMYIPDVVSGGKIDYGTLVKWISKKCPPCAGDPCIPLANIHLEGEGEDCHCAHDIDITVRPIVYTNDLLFQLLLSMMQEPDYRTQK